MTKIKPTYNYSRQPAITPRTVTVDRCPDGTVRRPASAADTDRITLSDAGLTAAAQFSNLVQRPTDAHTLALPAPLNIPSPNNTIPTEPADETPTSRKLVRTAYAGQQQLGSSEMTFPGSQINFLA